MIRLAIRVRREQAELVLAELLELAPSGVEETSPAADMVEYSVFGPPGELPELPDLRAAAGAALVEISTEEIADDWAERWRAFHKPLVLGERLTVRPPWEPPGATPVDLVIDPGQAFGTGAHATTRLCLELLLSLTARGPLLDLGCGSGVLAIAAARLGFAPVTALDNDPAAVSATAENAARNGVEIETGRFDLRRDPLPLAAGPTVVANLLGPLLLELAARLASTPESRPAHLIASGLLVGEAEQVAEAFAPLGLIEQEQHVSGDWAALLLSAV